MQSTIWAVFGVVYLGMVLGRLPRLQLDRTGVALLGAIVLVAAGVFSLDEAVRQIDAPTIALLFAFMVVSAQLRMGGFYNRVIEVVAQRGMPPRRFLAAVMGASGLLSAVFTNDIVCLAATPVLIHACRRRSLNPVPFLLALACSSNIGSAATLIGNPQNILIGQVLRLSFGGYCLEAFLPALLGLAITWAVIVIQYRRDWHEEPAGGGDSSEFPGWNPWQSGKGLLVTGFLFLAFLMTDWPRDVLALAAAGVLLMSRKLHSRKMLGLIDWQLLVLFCGLFIVNRAAQATHGFSELAGILRGLGVDPEYPGWLFGISVVLSNTVSNVPAVMLLLPFATHDLAGPVLALSSTLAGNLFIVGSIANIIVVDMAARHGVTIGWSRHARTGVPVGVLSLLGTGLIFLARATF